MKNYFPHDLNARNDEKITNLLMTKNYEGLGIYWCIVEMLYENNGWLDYSCERIAFELRTHSDCIKSIIEDFNLFIFSKDKKKFSSPRVLSQIEFFNTKSKNAQKSAKIKWNKYYANAMRTQSDGKANAMLIKENKIKENKIKENKINNIATPSVADTRITDILNSFKDINPTINFGNKTQRQACSDLIKQFTLEKVINTLNYYKTIRGDKFSPVITTPYQLKEKMGQLIAYYNKSQTPQKGGMTII